MGENPIISVIIPVYNVEPYLRKCLDSVVNQTYRNLEILIIDDGSTDGSGRICDEYLVDKRVKVFHTKNRGLSSARNLGLDEATGEWTGFVDSDDWIELDMYEFLLKKALEIGADVVECGVFKKYPDRTEKYLRRNAIMSGNEALHALLDEELSETVWNKLWKQNCFKTIRFPEERIFEDIATTYKIYANINCFCSIAMAKYHYTLRASSLSQYKDIKNLKDLWNAHHERYNALLISADNRLKERLLFYCAAAAARAWVYYYDCKKEDRVSDTNALREMNEFTKNNIPLLGCATWNYKIRIGIIFPHYLSSFSFAVAWLINRLGKAIKSCETYSFMI